MAYNKQSFTTPKGNLLWAFIGGEGRKGKFSIVVKAHKDEPEVIEAMKTIDDFWTENRPKSAKPRPSTKAYKFEEDAETGEETGYVYFSLSTPTTWGKTGDPKVVKVFSARPPVSEVDLGSKKIGEDSIGRGMGTLSIYEYEGKYGSTLYLDAVSLSKFREYVGGVDSEDVVTDDDAEDLGAMMATTDVSDMKEEEDDTPKPRV